MANTMRWRYGDTNPIMAPVDATTVIEIGDLVYLDTDDAKPASTQADQGSELTNQQLLHDNFLGVAMQSSSDGDANSIRVATTGVFELDCSAAVFEIGALVGATEDSSGSALENQRVVAVVDAAAAIGRCASRVSPAGTRVLVDVVGSVTKGGVQTIA